MENRKRYSYLTSELDAAYHEAARRLGVSDSAMRVLYTICLRGGACPLGDIVRLSGISKQTINSALRKLEEGGAVETVGGKRKQVYLTAGGKQLARNTALRVLKLEDEIFAAWPEAEVTRYVALTEKFLSDFKDKLKGLQAGEENDDSAFRSL